MYSIRLQFHSSACGYPVFPASFEETMLSPFCSPSIFVCIHSLSVDQTCLDLSLGSKLCTISLYVDSNYYRFGMYFQIRQARVDLICRVHTKCKRCTLATVQLLQPFVNVIRISDFHVLWKRGIGEYIDYSCFFHLFHLILCLFFAHRKDKVCHCHRRVNKKACMMVSDRNPLGADAM